MESFKIIMGFLEALFWPLVALVVAFKYHDIFSRLLPGAKVTLKIFNVGVETTIPVLQESIRESLGGRDLYEEERLLINKLHEKGRTAIGGDVDVARKLRNVGLLKWYPERGQLKDAKEIELTGLGKLLAQQVIKVEEERRGIRR